MRIKHTKPTKAQGKGAAPIQSKAATARGFLSGIHNNVNAGVNQQAIPEHIKRRQTVTRTRPGVWHPGAEKP